jgi:acyl-CoA synthetase (AMP-forming)/AMP-acid ligase II/acyl carrier protein
MSAQNIRATLALGPTDRCLNIMPLFHIHGLVGALLSSLAARASVVCTPGFYAPEFFAWVKTFQPTWYTAVPTMHQAILARASQEADVLSHSSLRLIRSSSAPLPPQVLAELERVFRVPVLEAYGMTEAAHQMASNPLPPRPRKAGSVGRAAGPDIAILDEAGNRLPPGTKGEIAIQGANVMRGYENNPEANATTFTHGWFRTGDQGYLDADGYLFLTGRIKEIINRGGEKIAPREVDEVLLDHPAVAQAVAFALPHPRLGEEVAAAVVVRSAMTATEQELRAFAATRLADFKVPRRIVILGEIPKGPTGKPQRIGLAERLGLVASPEELTTAPYQAPRTPTEQTLTDIWAEVLRVPGPGIDDEFLHLGGDSILAAQVLARVRQAFGIELSLLAFFETPTIAGLAGLVEQQLLERANEEELDRQLAELAELSPEDVERLLRQETQAPTLAGSEVPDHAFTDADVALKP